MDVRQPPAVRNPSRKVAIAAVAVLVAIAIAGIVLVGQRGRGDLALAPGVADATQAAASAMTVARVETEAGPNNVVFAAGSDRLSEPATAKLTEFAEKAKQEKRRTIVIAGRAQVGTDGTALATRRANAVRRLFEEKGLRLGDVQIKINHVPPGAMSASEADRLHFSAP